MTKADSRFFLVYIIIVASFFDNFSQFTVMSPFAKSLGAGVWLVGWIVAIYSLFNMVGNFFAGAIIMRYGKRNSMAAGLFAGAFAVFLYSLVANPAELMLVRILHGLAVAIVVPAAFAYIGDQSKELQRGKDMAKTGIAISIAALTGPAFGGIISHRLGTQYVFYGVAVVLIMAALFARFGITEIASEGKQETESNALDLLKRHSLVIPFVTAFALLFAKGTLVFSLPLYIEELGLPASYTGMLLSTFGLAAILVFATSFNRVSDRIGRSKPIITGLILITAALVTLPSSEKLIPIFIAMFIYGIGFGLVFPAATAAVVDGSALGERGTAFGVFYGIFSLGVVSGPIVTGFFAQLGVAPLLIAAMVTFTGSIVILKLSRS